MCQRLKLSLESELERAEERISRQVEEKTEMRQILEEEKRKLLEAENVIEIGGGFHENAGAFLHGDYHASWDLGESRSAARRTLTTTSTTSKSVSR